MKFNVDKKAPLYHGYWDEEKFFFMDKEKDYFAKEKEKDDFMSAIVSICISSNKCPTAGHLTQFCLTSAMVKHFKNQTIDTTKDLLIFRIDEVLIGTWNVLWDIFYRQKNDDLVRKMLNIFVPCLQDVDHMSKICYESHFYKTWHGVNSFPNTIFNKVCNVHEKHIEHGMNIFREMLAREKKLLESISKHTKNILCEVNEIILGEPRSLERFHSIPGYGGIIP